MAVEKSPGDKGSFAPAPDPAPAPEPKVDEEKYRMAEELRQAKAALGEVGQMVQSGKLVLKEEKPAAEVPEDDSALVDRKELKRFSEDIKRTVAGAIVETTAQSARQIRSAQIEHLRGKLKNFDKYEAEVGALLDKVDPRLAADPATITQVYRVVRANHIDDEIAAGVAARGAEPAEPDEDEVWGETKEEATEYKERHETTGRGAEPKPVARHSGGVAPSGDASASRPSLLPRKERVQGLSADEKRIAMQFGISSAEEFRRYGDRSWEPDTQGSKGRNRF